MSAKREAYEIEGEDRIMVVVMAATGVQLTREQANEVWVSHSESYHAGWLAMSEPENGGSAVEILQAFQAWGYPDDTDPADCSGSPA